MNEKPPFDLARAAFYLVAGVIAVHCVVVMLGVGFCLYYAQDIVEQRLKCDPQGKLSELLAAALAAALAFAGGKMR